MAAKTHSVSAELHVARQRWGKLSDVHRLSLMQLLKRFRFSIISGDLLLIEGGWYLTHSGLLRLAARRGCSGIVVIPVREYCNSQASRWVFEATVYTSRTCTGFVGYGDADPSNVSPLVRGAEMRVAETRAVNRALRKAYGIGICSVEELGALSGHKDGDGNTRRFPPQRVNSSEKANGKGNGQPRLRDELCLLIRQHGLHASLVKRHATEFCAVADLRQAKREQVEAFIKYLREFAARDVNGLVAKLGSYADKPESAGAA